MGNCLFQNENTTARVGRRKTTVFLRSLRSILFVPLRYRDTYPISFCGLLFRNDFEIRLTTSKLPFEFVRKLTPKV